MDQLKCHESLSENDLKNGDLVILKIKDRLLCLSIEKDIKPRFNKPFFVVQEKDGIYEPDSNPPKLKQSLIDKQNEEIPSILFFNKTLSLDKSFISRYKSEPHIFEAIISRKVLLFENKQEYDIPTTLYTVRQIPISNVFNSIIVEKEFSSDNSEQNQLIKKVCDRNEPAYDITSGENIKYDEKLIIMYLEKNKEAVYCYTINELKNMLAQNIKYSKTEVIEMGMVVVVKLLFWSIYVDMTKLSHLLNLGFNTIELIKHESPPPSKFVWYEPISSSRDIIFPKSNFKSTFESKFDTENSYIDVGDYRYRRRIDYYYEHKSENDEIVFQETKRIDTISWIKYKINSNEKPVLESYNDKPAYIKHSNDVSNKIKEEKWYTNGKLNRTGDKPAWIEYNNLNKIFKFYTDGILYKTAWFYSNDILYKEEYMKDNKIYKKVEYNNETKVEKWYKDDMFNNDDDKPSVIVYENNLIIREEWYTDGIRNRKNDKPSWIVYYNNGILNKNENRGSLEAEIWYVKNMIQRDNDLPSAIEYYKNDDFKIKNVKTLTWTINSLTDREKDQPSEIEYYENGKKKEETWYQKGRIKNRGELPSKIKYYQNGSIESYKWENPKEGEPTIIEYYETKEEGKIGPIYQKIWYQYDDIGRKNDLPAVVMFYKNGSIKGEAWYLYGFNVRKDNQPSLIEYYENNIPNSRGQIKEQTYTDNEGKVIKTV